MLLATAACDDGLLARAADGGARDQDSAGLPPDDMGSPTADVAPEAGADRGIGDLSGPTDAAVTPSDAGEPPGCGPGGVEVNPPASDLAAVVQGHPPGTCFALAPGKYSFHSVRPKDGMRFFGASNTTVVVDGSGHETAFFGNAKNVTIADMELEKFDNLMGQIAQEQAPIRGTTEIWASKPEQRASGWTIERMVIHDNPASGINVGHDFVVRDCVFYNNVVTGIGGGRFVGGLIENNEIYACGSTGAPGAGVNNAGLKFAFAHGGPGQVIIRGNHFHDNFKRGIWCDLDCDGVLIENNTVTNHTSSGIFIEISQNVVVRGNTVINSNASTNYTADWNPGAITIAESGHVLVEKNTIEDNVSGIALTETKRPAAGEDWLKAQVAQGNVPNLTLNNVTVKDNTLVNNESVGASHGPSGAGLADYATIKFSGNSYDAPAKMAFWWQAQKRSYAEWQALGLQ